MNLVALHSVVLCHQMTFGNSCTHFPFLRLKQAFFDGFEDNTVGSFHCSVGLWMVHRGEHDLRAHIGAEILEELVIELFSVIHCDFTEDSKSTDDILPKGFLHR